MSQKNMMVLTPKEADFFMAAKKLARAAQDAHILDDRGSYKQREKKLGELREKYVDVYLNDGEKR